RGEEAGGLRPVPAPPRRGRAAPHRHRPQEPQPGRPQAGHVLAGPVQRPAGPHLLRGSPEALSRPCYVEEVGPLILVVDDTKDTRELFVEYLRLAGFEAEQAESGTEALR